jgi:hypothetical protein
VATTMMRLMRPVGYRAALAKRKSRTWVR